MTQIERAAWQAADSRRQRELAERQAAQEHQRKDEPT